MPEIFTADLLIVAISRPPSGVSLLAYIDPGAGSILLQALVAGLAGCTVLVSMFWRNIRRFFGSLFKTEPKEAPVQEPVHRESPE